MFAIKSCLEGLSVREEKILRLRFGIAEDLLHDDNFEVTSKNISEITQE